MGKWYGKVVLPYFDCSSASWPGVRPRPAPAPSAATTAVAAASLTVLSIAKRAALKTGPPEGPLYSYVVYILQ